MSLIEKMEEFQKKQQLDRECLERYFTANKIIDNGRSEQYYSPCVEQQRTS